MEDELRLKQTKLGELQGEAKTQSKVVNKTAANLEKINNTEENKAKADSLT